MAFYSLKDIQKLVTMEMIRFIMENPDFILNNTSYGSDLSFEAACESLDGKEAMLCGLKRLTRWEGDQLIDVDKCALIFQVYGEKTYKTIKVLFDLGYYRFVDNEEDYRKIMKEIREKHNRRLQLQRTHDIEKTIITLTYDNKLFDMFARKYYNTYGEQFKGEIINCKRKNYRENPYYFVDYILSNKKGNVVKRTIFLH